MWSSDADTPTLPPSHLASPSQKPQLSQMKEGVWGAQAPATPSPGMKFVPLQIPCGSFMMDNISRDYGWEKYSKLNQQICDKLGLDRTMFFYIVKDKNNKLYSIGKLLGSIKQ